MEHLGKRDLPDFRVIRRTVSRAGRQILQKFDIVLALFFEMIEGVFGVGISIEIEIHLRVVSFEEWALFIQEAIHPHAVAVALRVGEVCKHLSDRKAVGSGLPASIVVRDFPHQAAQNLRRRLQKVKARQIVFEHENIVRRSLALRTLELLLVICLVSAIWPQFAISMRGTDDATIDSWRTLTITLKNTLTGSMSEIGMFQLIFLDNGR